MTPYLPQRRLGHGASSDVQFWNVFTSHLFECSLIRAYLIAGKTNVAMMSILNVLGQYQKERTEMEVEQDEGQSENLSERFDLSAFKIIYVAPMKALVQEVVKNFSKRLGPYGVVVREVNRVPTWMDGRHILIPLWHLFFVIITHLKFSFS